ncbi:MAG: methylmalonyl-CoA mutase family protein [Thermodesulfobacteriota bacterium]
MAPSSNRPAPPAAAWAGLEPLRTSSGLEVRPLYGPQDVADQDWNRELGLPGQFPYVRGVYPTMYRGRTWTQRQLAGFGHAQATNQRYRFLLEAGAEAINGIFDFPTLRGLDSTHPQAQADAGRGGVAIDTLADMVQLFEGLPIQDISVSLVSCNPTCNIVVQSMYFAVARQRGLDLNQLAGTNQNDFLMETAVTTAPEVLEPWASFKLCCDAIEFCARRARRWNPVSFAGYNYREAGCTAVQEVAFVLANALACSQELLRRGLAFDDFAPRLSFFLSAHNDFFEEIAKYRAARRIWARLVRQRFGPSDPRSERFRFHVQTAGAALTAQQPLNNITRAAYHALAAVLGGAQSVHVDGYDEALCIPTELASLTALRSQQILQLETGVTRSIDPLGGSFMVESLTNQMEAAVLAKLAQIEERGGILRAVEEGWLHQEIADAAYQHQQGVESGDVAMVGVNCFRMDEEPHQIEIFAVPETLSVQRAKLERILAQRDPAAARRALESVRRCCREEGNLMETLLEAVPAMLTQGEITKVLQEHYGTWTPPLF